MKYLILLSLLFLVGCTKTVYIDRNITVENNITLPCVCQPVLCPACPEPTTVTNTVTVPDTTCEANRGEIVRALADCWINNTKLENQMKGYDEGDCYEQLTNCNETVIDYIHRLDNITFISERNRWMINMVCAYCRKHTTYKTIIHRNLKIYHKKCYWEEQWKLKSAQKLWKQSERLKNNESSYLCKG